MQYGDPDQKATAIGECIHLINQIHKVFEQLLTVFHRLIADPSIIKEGDAALEVLQ